MMGSATAPSSASTSLAARVPDIDERSIAARSHPDGTGVAAKILIVGGGYAGFYTAWKLEKHLRKGEADVTIVDPLGQGLGGRAALRAPGGERVTSAGRLRAGRS